MEADMLTGWIDFDRSFSMLDDFRARMDQLFSEYDTGRRLGGFETVAWPRVNLYDGGESYLVKAELPGVGESDLQIQATQESLTVSGERRTTVPEGYSVHRQERAPVRFSRSLAFPTRVDTEGIKADLRNGILTITVPKAPEVKPKAISISIG